jgi:phosphatidylserine decarboxylase
MAATAYPGFSREGRIPLFLSILAGVVLWNAFGFLWSLPAWLLAIVALYVFRDPDREIPSSPLAVVSPADGCVSRVDLVDDPYLDRRAFCVQLDMNRFGAFATRSPVEGKVLEPRGNGGARVEGMPQGVWLKTDEDDDLVVAMGRGPLHNAPRCSVRFGERVGQGQRCGYIHFGGRIQLYLPENSRLVVNVGDQVKGGADVIAHLVHK